MAVSRFKLRLYVRSDNSRQALRSLYKALEYHDFSDYELVIIDIAQQPVRATDEGIVKTPTLVAELSGGGWLISDDFENIDQLRATFGFRRSKC